MNKKSLPGTNYLMIMGIILIVFGIIAIVAPAFAGKMFVYVIGGLLLVTGVVQFVGGLRQKSWHSKLMPMVLGIITTICGIAILGHPIFGMTIFTLILAIFFFVEGFWKIIASFSFRPSKGQRRVGHCAGPDYLVAMAPFEPVGHRNPGRRRSGHDRSVDDGYFDNHATDAEGDGGVGGSIDFARFTQRLADVGREFDPA